MMVLMGAVTLLSYALHSSFKPLLQQNARGVNQRSCENRSQIGESGYLQRVLLSRQGRSQNSWQAQTARRSTWLQGLEVRRLLRKGLIRSIGDENGEAETDRKEQNLDMRQHRRGLTPPSADEINETEEGRKEEEEEEEVLDVVASTPSVEALSEIDSTITYTRSTSSSPVRHQPQKSGRRRSGGGMQWILGPLALLITGAVPALWLPSPTLFSGSATAGLLALTGLDATFNMGATAFLLMADSSAGGKSQDPSPSQSSIPLGYKVWSFLVNFVGLMAPIALVVASKRGVLQFQPLLPVLPAAALLGPYTLLMVVQWLGELLVWHWQSPVWPVLPLVYQAYRLLQLTRGIELGEALDAPAWLVEAVKGLVAWWVFVLGMQIMWVAWLVGTIQNRYARPR